MVERHKNPPSDAGRACPVRVDVFRAEELAAGDPHLDEVMIRETLKGEPVGRTRDLIRWANKRSPRNPYRKLRQWARRNERGFYSKAVLRRDAGEVYKKYLAYVEVKRAEQEATTAAPTLSPERLGVLIRIFYAPRMRTELVAIIPVVWAQFHEELEAEARCEDIA